MRTVRLVESVASIDDAIVDGDLVSSLVGRSRDVFRWTSGSVGIEGGSRGGREGSDARSDFVPSEVAARVDGSEDDAVGGISARDAFVDGVVDGDFVSGDVGEGVVVFAGTSGGVGVEGGRGSRCDGSGARAEVSPPLGSAVVFGAVLSAGDGEVSLARIDGISDGDLVPFLVGRAGDVLVGTSRRIGIEGGRGSGGHGSRAGTELEPRLLARHVIRRTMGTVLGVGLGAFVGEVLEGDLVSGRVGSAFDVLVGAPRGIRIERGRGGGADGAGAGADLGPGVVVGQFSGIAMGRWADAAAEHL
mmetsp:Transcript_22257/g.44757  ORF Transcript_22257/g.44757 Transcript_22257/m.44757 type:complete len:303 (+) Transcript_22257:849-1757(+)